MTNFNPMQFINSFISGYNTAKSANIQNNAQLNQTVQTEVQNQQMQTLLPNTTARLNITAAELAMLNQEQTVNMLKELLNFPKELQQLFSQLIANSQISNRDLGLILLAASTNLPQLSSLLQGSAKEAMTNLYQMLAQYNQLGLSIKDEQLYELSKFISFISAASTNDIQSLKTTLMLYLPWLPLTNPEAFKLELGKKGSDGGSISDDFISVLIATENYGNFQADIYKTDQDGIKIQSITSQTFPVEVYINLMKEEGKKYNININFDTAKKEVFNKEKNEKTSTQVCMNVGPGVNPFLLLISNSLIKAVHLIDTKEKLKEQRREKLENGKS